MNMSTNDLVMALAGLEYTERREVLERADRLAASYWEDGEDPPTRPQPHWSKELL